MSEFVYVFSSKERDILLSEGYQLLKSDEAKHLYIFLNKDKQNFSCDGVQYVLSNTLTF